MARYKAARLQDKAPGLIIGEGGELNFASTDGQLVELSRDASRHSEV